MKFVYFLSKFPYYSETFIQREIDLLINNGHSVEIVSLDYRNPINGAYNIVKTSINPFRTLKYIFKNIIKNQSSFFSFEVVRVLAKCCVNDPKSIHKYLLIWFNLDYISQKLFQDNTGKVVVSHFLFRSTAAGYLLAQTMKFDLHLKLHTHSSTLPQNVIGQIINYASEISAISSHCADYFQKYIPQDKPIRISRQKINLDVLHGIHKKTTRSSLIQIICIGRLIAKKGFERLILCLSELPLELKNKVQLTIVGKGPNEKELKQLVEKLELQNMISLLGQQSHQNTLEKLANSDILVVPSVLTQTDQDGIPTVIPEAMVLKTLVVTSDVGGITELVKNGDNGFVFDQSSTKELKDKLIYTILNVRNLTNIVQNGYDTVIKEY